MRRILVPGEPERVRPFRLAGACVVEGADANAIHRAWADRPDDVAVLVLTSTAAEILGQALAAEPRLVWAVMP